MKILLVGNKGKMGKIVSQFVEGKHSVIGVDKDETTKMEYDCVLDFSVPSAIKKA